MKIKIYYDKECPFCNKYAQIVKLKNKNSIGIFNARYCLDEIRNFRNLGFDINDGIIIIVEDKDIYQGADAIRYLDNLDKNFYSLIFHTRLFKSVLYPIIKYFRWLVLKIVGKNPTIKF